MYKDAPPAVLRAADLELSLLRSPKGNAAERGCLRHWAGFTWALLRRCEEKKIPPQITPELVSQTVSQYAYAPDDRADDE